MLDFCRTVETSTHPVLECNSILVQMSAMRSISGFGVVAALASAATVILDPGLLTVWSIKGHVCLRPFFWLGPVREFSCVRCGME